jgi:hypothetical protein
MDYLAVVQVEPGESCRIELPDFPGSEQECESVGEAIAKANDLVRETVRELAASDADVPRALRKDELQDREEYRNAFLVRVEVATPRRRGAAQRRR